MTDTTVSNATSSSATGAASNSTQSAAKLSQDMDYFLNLLVTQLKNQDPLDPMKPNEFTNQLVQFSSVEQQIQSNSNLEKMISLQKANNVSSVVSYIDKNVEVSGGDLTLENGYSAGSYTLDKDATKTTIIIKDADGNTVFSTSGETSAGRHNFTWDGINNQGYTAPDGDYTVTVSAIDDTGSPIDVTQTTAGRVNAVTMQDGNAALYIGNHVVPVENVVAIGSQANSAGSGSSGTGSGGTDNGSSDGSSDSSGSDSASSDGSGSDTTNTTDDNTASN